MDAVYDLMICPQIRVYTKKPGEGPDFEDGIILRNGVTVKHVCHAIHRTLPAVFKFALVWVSWKQQNQRYLKSQDRQAIKKYVFPYTTFLEGTNMQPLPTQGQISQ